MWMLKVSFTAIALAAGLCAAPIAPVSYDMRNGDGQASSGSFNYWDKEYTGAGATTTDAAPLTGGLGNLTDGVVAANNWNVEENAAGTGPYVGWRQTNGVPVVTFLFGANYAFGTMTLYLDDADGFGGVDLPASVDVLIDGVSTNHAIFPQAGSGPKVVSINLGGRADSAVQLTLNYQNEWIFLSEVTFDGRPAEVPEPATAGLSAAGLAAALLLRQRFGRAARR